MVLTTKDKINNRLKQASSLKMKTIKEIENKVEKLLQEYKKEKQRENLCSIYEKKLDDFIGDFDSYSYFDRQKIFKIQQDFFKKL